MAISIDDIDIDDVVDVSVSETDPAQQTAEEPTQTGEEETVVEDNQPEEPDEQVDVIASLLKQKGIDDPTKIKFLDDNDQVQEKNWNDLTSREQLNILQNNEQPVDDNTQLDDSEIDLINRLRLSNMTPEEFVATIKQQGVAEYMSQQGAPEPTYSIDDLTDEELYVLDLQARIGQDKITEEELQEALDRAKSNEALFAKEIAGLRDEYHRLEDEKNQKDAAYQQQLAQDNFDRYAYGVVNAINNFDSLGELSVDMDDDDKNEIYTFLTGTDNAGISYLQKALNDPETLVQMAWFALKGEDVINSVSDYYKAEITKAHRAGYDEGVKKASSNKQPADPKVVVKRPENKEVKKRMSIDDIDW